MSSWAKLSDTEKRTCFDTTATPLVFEVSWSRRLKAWKPQGKLLDQWIYILPEFLEVANAADVLEPLTLKNQRETSPINWELFLIGSKARTDKLTPTILALHEDIEVAKRGAAAFQKLQTGPLSGLLWGFDIQYAKDPLDLCADTDEDMPTVNGVEKISLCGAPITIHQQTGSTSSDPAQDSWRRATVGGSIIIKNRHYVMTAAHAFADQSGSTEDSNSLVFDVYTTVDAIERTDDDTQKTTPTLPNIDASLPSTIRICSHPGIDTLTGYKDERILINHEGDWALIPITNPRFTSSNVVQFTDGEKMQVRGHVVDRPAGAVYALSSVTRPAPTNVTPSPAITLLPGAKKLKMTWSLPRRSSPGDCGSWVVDDEGRVFAMIVATSESRGVTFCLPISNILGDIRRLFEDTSPELIGTQQETSAAAFVRMGKYKHSTPGDTHTISSSLSSIESESTAHEGTNQDPQDPEIQNSTQREMLSDEEDVEEKMLSGVTVPPSTGEGDDTQLSDGQLPGKDSTENARNQVDNGILAKTVNVHHAQVENVPESDETREEVTHDKDSASARMAKDHVMIRVEVDERDNKTYFRFQEEDVTSPPLIKELLRINDYVFDDLDDGGNGFVVQRCLDEAEIKFLSNPGWEHIKDDEYYPKRPRIQVIRDFEISPPIAYAYYAEPGDAKTTNPGTQEPGKMRVGDTDSAKREEPHVTRQLEAPVQMQDTYSGIVMRFHNNVISPEALDEYRHPWRLDSDDKSYVQVLDILTAARIKELKDYTKRHAKVIYRSPSPVAPRRPRRQRTFRSEHFDPNRQDNKSSAAALVRAGVTAKGKARDDGNDYARPTARRSREKQLTDRDQRIAEACSLVDTNFEMQLRDLFWVEGLPRALCEQIVGLHARKEMEKSAYLKVSKRERELRARATQDDSAPVASVSHKDIQAEILSKPMPERYEEHASSRDQGKPNSPRPQETEPSEAAR